MYRYTPDEFDKERAHHQAVIQGADNRKVKRIGNLGELAFEQFCREYLPVELWEWKNEQAIRQCNPESFSAYDFEVFGYEVDVKTSRDVSAFLPESLLENDPDDDIVVMVWHRDNEDSLILLGWERLETLKSKAQSQENFSGEAPEKLDHLAARPMNELLDLGPNTAHMNQKPQNPFKAGDRVVKAGDADPSVAVVIEVLPPERKLASTDRRSTARRSGLRTRVHSIADRQTGASTIPQFWRRTVLTRTSTATRSSIVTSSSRRTRTFGATSFTRRVTTTRTQPWSSKAV